VSAKKATAKKATAKKATAKKASAKKATAKKATAKKATAGGSSAVLSQPMPAEPGDVILIDSHQVGSPPREGDVLEVVQGEVSLSYRIRWADGHQSLITPASGTARIIRASERA
jgi:hypothetical protein